MKRLLLFFLVLLLFTGCNPKQAPEQIEDKSHIKQESSTKEENNNTPSVDSEIKYTVKNDGGNFSSEDLIYFIMVDRFYDGDETNNNFDDVDKNDPIKFHGGDIKGIIEKLDYIKSLGATAIWLTPVLKNEPNGYHGYWTYDFYDVDPHFGSMKDLKLLVEKAHSMDIKVLFDHIVNHTGYNHPWVTAPEKEDWFHPKKDITNWNDQKQVEDGWLHGLPDLNQDNPEVSKYLYDNTLWWIENTGIDGMRLDTMRHVSKEFWNEFAKEIKDKYPDFYLIGEVWNNNPRYLELYHQVGIDGMTNYPLFDGIRDTFKQFGKTSALVSAIEKEKFYSNPEINGVFLDNHDNKRLITQAGDNGEEYLRQALAFVMTYKAIPVIYYGTEIAMEGGDDPDNRRDMQWEKIQDSKTLEFYKTLVTLRQSNEALKSGEFKLLDYDNEFISYSRYTDDKAVIVIINIKDKQKEVSIDIDHSAISFKNIFSDTVYSAGNGKIKIDLKPFDIIILESK
ncbi:MAG: alpha-amylase [Epulopiscium sp.]|nr:alpha-amylase [Candidatus Epulonipiscium sp.]